jgi:hypothetical protein
MLAKGKLPSENVPKIEIDTERKIDSENKIDSDQTNIGTSETHLRLHGSSGLRRRDEENEVQKLHKNRYYLNL